MTTPARQIRRGITASAAVLGLGLYACSLPPEALSDQVKDVCHQKAKGQLKAPSTADFGGDLVEQMAGPKWSDLGYVDAENSFGAKVRTDYTCTAVHTGGTSWQVRVVLHDF